MKASDIIPKHLVLGEVYDDFAKATDKVDFSKEDLCCQVVGLTSVYYWINTESVWGPLGFIWYNYNDYGYFSKSTIDFSIIPKIPDSYRHKRLYNIFYNLNNSLTFLDSGWNHINDFHLGTSSYVDWYLNLDDDNEHIINNRINFSLRGCNRNTKINSFVELKLLPENKNNLDLKIRAIDGSYTNIVNFENIESENLDVRDYVHIHTIGSYLYDRLMCLSHLDGVKHLTVELGTINNYSFAYLMGVTLNNTNNNINTPLESLTYILLNDLLKEQYNPDKGLIIENFKIRNLNEIYSKNFIYENIEDSYFSSIDYYYKNGRFEYDTPEVTQKMLDFTTISIFRNCRFFKPYKYGKVRCINKYFYDEGNNNVKMNTNSLLYDKKPIYAYTYNNTTNQASLILNSNCTMNYTDLFEFEYTEEDLINKRKITYPNDINGSNLFYTCDIKLNYLPIIYNNDRVTTTKGDIEYFNVTINTLFIPDSDYKIIINNDTNLKLGMNSTSEAGSIYCESNEIDPYRIIIKTNNDNITDNKIAYSNPLLWHFCKHFNRKIPYIVRNSITCFVINDKTSYNRKYGFLPKLDDEILAYHIEINFTYKADEKVSNNVVQHILDSIITIGNAEDSKDKEITLLSEYYQSMKEETKERLICDGYTIIEIL